MWSTSNTNEMHNRWELQFFHKLNTKFSTRIICWLCVQCKLRQCHAHKIKKKRNKPKRSILSTEKKWKRIKITIELGRFLFSSSSADVSTLGFSTCCTIRVYIVCDMCSMIHNWRWYYRNPISRRAIGDVRNIFSLAKPTHQIWLNHKYGPGSHIESHCRGAGFYHFSTQCSVL